MWENYYLLELEAVSGGELSEKKRREEMEAFLDQERLLKYRQKKNGAGALQSLGAGVLLQLAVREYEAEKRRQGGAGGETFDTEADGTGCSERLGGEMPLKRYTPETLLKEAVFKGKGALEIRYRRGAQGKPYFAQLPLYFSLSHSGRAVFLAVSEREIGADIQNVRGTDWRALARRFYKKAENEELERAERTLGQEKAQELFYRLWTRKEAYGKLTGRGLTGVLEQEIPGAGQGIGWLLETLTLGGEEYYLAVCREERPQE